jgi:hypothetical protein
MQHKIMTTYPSVESLVLRRPPAIKKKFAAAANVVNVISSVAECQDFSLIKVAVAVVVVNVISSVAVELLSGCCSQSCDSATDNEKL